MSLTLPDGEGFQGPSGIARYKALGFFAALVQAVLVMGLAASFNDMPPSGLWAACLDIGERDSGRVAGVVNPASGLGGFLSPIAFGEPLQRGYGWSPALNLAGAFFLLGGLCQLAVDLTQTVAAAALDAEFV